MELIRRGKLEKVFGELEARKDKFDPEQDHDFTTYSAQFYRLKEKMEKKTIRESEIEVEQGKILQNLINFVKNLEGKL